MKKLIFDDFQADTGRKFIVEEVGEEIPSPPEISPVVTVTPMKKPAIENFTALTPETKPAAHEFQVADFFDLDSPMFKGDAEPRAEFDFLLGKVLGLIKDVTFAHSVAFFWANRDKGQMVCEAHVSDSVSFLKRRRFFIGHDLVSKVANTGKPELITDVNPLSEQELIPYYDDIVHVKSFAGVPVYFCSNTVTSPVSQPVAVVVLDSIVEGTFGSETLQLLGQFTKLTSGLIKGYTEKYDLLLEAEVLSSLGRFQEHLKEDFSVATATDLLAEETCRLVNLDYLSIVLYDEKKHVWSVRKVVNRAHEPYIAPEQVIDFPGSIAAETIKNNICGFVEQTGEGTMPRFIKAENIGTNGSFLSLPISSLNKCYGCLNLERREKFSFTQQDAEILTHLTANAAKALEVLYMNDIIREYVIIDDITGVYSRKFFLQRLDEELKRSDDSGTELSLLLIGVDNAHDIVQRFGQEGFNRVMNSLAKAIRSSIRQYDFVGRLESNRFAIILINTAATDAYLWSEKIRKTVAGHVVELDGKSFSMTISAGVAGALEGVTRDGLMENAITVLHKASTDGGNAVRVY